MTLVAPSECQTTNSVRKYLERLIKTDKKIRSVRYFNLRQSMRNGGGPACLRLRVVLREEERSAIKTNTFLSDENYPELVTWAKKHYRDRLNIKDLADPKLLNECRAALDELTQIFKIGSIYPFQK